MMAYSTLDALNSLCSSIPDWNQRLDELKGQISLRQIELARLTDQRPPTRSIKNKGSTESLRPQDGNENPFLTNEVDGADAIPLNPFDSPTSLQNGFATSPRSSSSAAAGPAAAATPPPKASSNPRPSPSALYRQSSQPTPPTQPRLASAILRKRKTDSLASGESLAPKYRTRSMIIVYYDSAVQTAFEELVKFVSGCRNAMRKGKMAAKMADIRRAAELEIEVDDEDDDAGHVGDLVTRNSGMLAAQVNVAVGTEGSGLPGGGAMALDQDVEPADMPMPKLRFVSTRQMGPTRDRNKNNDLGNTFGVGILRGYRRSAADGTPDIFDIVDAGLEWCQSQCEHAAHQFLREGDCDAEIDNIKRRLIDVKETAEKEIERLSREDAADPVTAPSTASIPDERKCRSLKAVQMRRELGTMKDLEVDTMEVDDEGVVDLEPPRLLYKRSKDIRH